MHISNTKNPLARILVIDDDQDTAMVIKQMLVRKNMIVDAFTSPAAALDGILPRSLGHTDAGNVRF
ncbi:MAG TPA: response regulator [Nitrososphaera sp.]|jgi:PleD family two-component response regulator